MYEDKKFQYCFVISNIINLAGLYRSIGFIGYTKKQMLLMPFKHCMENLLMYTNDTFFPFIVTLLFSQTCLIVAAVRLVMKTVPNFKYFVTERKTNDN